MDAADTSERSLNLSGDYGSSRSRSFSLRVFLRTVILSGARDLAPAVSVDRRVSVAAAAFRLFCHSEAAGARLVFGMTGSLVDPLLVLRRQLPGGAERR